MTTKPLSPFCMACCRAARQCCGAILALAALLASLLAGCAVLPHDVLRTASQARTDVEQSTLARVATASLAAGQSSALRLLPAGDQAFDARIALARSAEISIDAQYYVIANDLSGRQFLRELHDAAARGVRVRLLVDDLYAGGDDGLLDGLAAHRNVELRLFNPLPVRTGGPVARVLLSLHQLERVNRRMHNKLFVADNSFAICGGRNIADAYFGRSEPSHFIDMDVLVAGAAVRELSAAFDAFWNGPNAYPVESIAGARADPAVARARFGALMSGLARFVLPEGARDSLGRSGIGSQLAQGHVELQPAGVRVVADPAEWPEAAAGRSEGAVMNANLELLRTARSEVLVVSPYFVPMARMIDAFRHASSGGAQVSVMTNSLATTDEPLVHHGYMRHRSALLNLGVSLYELMPASESRSAETGSGHGSLGRLHAKLAVVDRRWFYVGSMNMDRRSAHCNTELGLVVDSPALAGELADLIRRERMPNSFSVDRAPGGGPLQWTYARDGRQWTLNREPDSNWAQRLRWSVLSLVVDEDYL
ncbi:phospholipase D-like domain-containing protein [Variovorax fucosicus]|uniref:phospholipase D-like domain-containing protein n=1 Tax=Variovorax fucosicus TaxID=3053517 RepID=UPI0025755263|nr:phospholipase D family protein [Variovorax sp. J22G47]MDM0057753.1 phospholipase D family protein [Variovorax sp. J22G47]